jgi:hypothetical protein
MKKIVFFIVIGILSNKLFSQAENPHFLMITPNYSLDNIEPLKAPIGVGIEGAYFINEWFGTGGKMTTTIMDYSFNDYTSTSPAMSYGITANAYVMKKIYRDFYIMPSIGFGYAYTSLPKVEKKYIQNNIEVVDEIFGTTFSSILFNPISIKGFWNFHQDMSAHVSIDYSIAVSNKWPEKTFGEFLSFGIGYTYYLNFKKEEK